MSTAKRSFYESRRVLLGYAGRKCLLCADQDLQQHSTMVPEEVGKYTGLGHPTVPTHLDEMTRMAVYCLKITGLANTVFIWGDADDWT